MLTAMHHVAIIASDYAKAKHFYLDILGLELIAEHYQVHRDSYKIDLRVPDGVQIELFVFNNPPPRPSYPEASGLRHLAFAVADIELARANIVALGVGCEEIRVDPYTELRFCFLADPDGLPIELYEVKSAI
ncbi:VOC family protein [Pseudoalteromonas fenneropenaei]|uniref:VOC family protein n=1 Tax=Pseudoalteromonas fenneropenaei TaxID=1737459 RepID=A0ABV7CKG0_9GAMM